MVSEGWWEGEEDWGRGRVYSWMMVGRKTGMELKATLQAKNMNCDDREWMLGTVVVFGGAHGCDIGFGIGKGLLDFFPVEGFALLRWLLVWFVVWFELVHAQLCDGALSGV